MVTLQHCIENVLICFTLAFRRVFFYGMAAFAFVAIDNCDHVLAGASLAISGVLYEYLTQCLSLGFVDIGIVV